MQCQQYPFLRKAARDVATNYPRVSHSRRVVVKFASFVSLDHQRSLDMFLRAPVHTTSTTQQTSAHGYGRECSNQTILGSACTLLFVPSPAARSRQCRRSKYPGILLSCCTRSPIPLRDNRVRLSQSRREPLSLSIAVLRSCKIRGLNPSQKYLIGIHVLSFHRKRFPSGSPCR